MSLAYIETHPVKANKIDTYSLNNSDAMTTWVINGNLDADGSRKAQPHIDNLLAQESIGEIEIDFRKVKFLDSSGIGAIVYLYKRLIERKRNMRIENVSGQPLEIIQLLRINQAIAVNSHSCSH